MLLFLNLIFLALSPTLLTQETTVTTVSDLYNSTEIANSTKAPGKKNKPKPTCNWMNLNPLEYQIFPETRTIFILDGHLQIPNANFSITGNQSARVRSWDDLAISNESLDYWSRFPILVCYPLSKSFLECKKWGITPSEYEFRGGKTIYNKAHSLTLQPDEYYISPKNSAVVCQNITNATNAISWCLTSAPYNIHLGMYITSVVFLLITVGLHILIPSINHHARSLMCHLLSLTGFYFGLAITKLANQDKMPPGLAYFCFITVQYFGLSTFFWLNVVAFDLWWKLSRMRTGDQPGFTRSRNSRFLFYSVYANGVPLILVIIVQIINASEVFKTNLHIILDIAKNGWFDRHDHTMVTLFFFGPVMLLQLLNLLFFFLTVLNLFQTGRQAQMANSSLNKQLFMVFVKLFVVMGVCWIFESVSYYFPFRNKCNWFVPDLLNAMQGIFIFLIYIVKPSTWRKMRGEFPRLGKMVSTYRSYHSSTNETSTTGVSTSFKTGPSGSEARAEQIKKQSTGDWKLSAQTQQTNDKDKPERPVQLATFHNEPPPEYQP